MIGIAIVFAAISWIEWKSIQKKSDEDKKKKWTILITIASLFILCEVLFLLRNVFQIDIFVKILFDKLEKWIMMEH
jgi:hypothetical protein